MNDQIKQELLNRVTIVNNLDNLVKYGNNFKKNLQQFSLFGDSIEIKPQIPQAEYINYDEIIAKEKDILGVCLTYNIFDRYYLVKKRFCNNTISSLNEMTESCPTGIMLLASVDDIEYRKSMSGNNYAKITIQDHNDSCKAYLWGKYYQNNISKIFKNQIYLIELGYKKDNESIFIVNIRKVEDIDPKDFISELALEIDKSNVIKVREYVFNNMFKGIQGDYNLIFRYTGVDSIAPYKVSFSESDYLYLKDLVINIEIKK